MKTRWIQIAKYLGHGRYQLPLTRRFTALASSFLIVHWQQVNNVIIKMSKTMITMSYLHTNVKKTLRNLKQFETDQHEDNAVKTIIENLPM